MSRSRLFHFFCAGFSFGFLSGRAGFAAIFKFPAGLRWAHRIPPAVLAMLFGGAAGFFLATFGAIPAAAQRGGVSPGQGAAIDAATAAVNDEFYWCSYSTNPATTIHFCSQVIDSGMVSGTTLSKPLNLRGEAYFHQGNYAHALDDLNRAILADLTNSAAFANRGDVHLAMGDYDAAIKDYEGALNADPYSYEAFVKRGLAYSREGQLDRAIQDYDHATRINPKYAPAYFDRAATYMSMGDYGRAITESNRAIQIRPDAAAYATRGSVYRAEGDYSRAVEDYARAVQLDPNSGDGFYGRGLTAVAQGKFSAARPDFARAVELQPGSANVYASLWLYVATARSGGNGRDELALVPAKYDSPSWPAPIVEMLLGRMTPASLLQSAGGPDPQKGMPKAASYIAKDRQDRECQAHFYAGEYYLIRGNSAPQARTELQAAAVRCSPASAEYPVAKMELGKLKGNEEK